MGSEIFLYLPNVIGYLRLSLLLLAWILYTHPLAFLPVYCISIALDGIDGYAARKLNQTSAFGAWLDVVIDVIGRGMLWCRLYTFGYFVAALEWLTFVCTHTLGSEWKSSYIQTPWLVRSVMANNFHTVMGFVAIGSMHILPVWLYAHYSDVLTDYLYIPRTVQYLCIAALSAGRALCAAVEIWCIWSHIQYLISDEANRPSSKSVSSCSASREQSPDYNKP